MRYRCAAVGRLLLSLAAILLSSSAAAQESSSAPPATDEWQLQWSAPAECEQAAYVRAEVERLSEPDALESASDLRAVGEVTHDGARYHLQLETWRAGTHGSVQLSSEECVPIARAAALVISVALGSPAEPAAPKPPPPPAPSPATPEDRPAAPPPVVRSAGPRLWLGLGIASEMKLLPKLSAGPSVTAELQMDSWSLASTFQHQLEVSETISPGAFATYSANAAALTGCGLIDSQSAAAIRACLGAQVGWIDAQARGTDRDQSINALYWGGVASLGLDYRLRPWLSLRAGGQLSLAATRAVFEVEGFGDVHQLPRWSLSASLGLLARL